MICLRWVADQYNLGSLGQVWLTPQRCSPPEGTSICYGIHISTGIRVLAALLSVLGDPAWV